MKIKAYIRPDKTIGIRNKILLIAVDECCEGILRGIAKEVEDTVILTNWLTCMLVGNEETYNQLIGVAKNPNVAGVLIVGMGCGSIAPKTIQEAVTQTGKPAEVLICQEVGGTRSAIKIGVEKAKVLQAWAQQQKRREVSVSKLIVGVKCGGSDTSSGIAANPAAGAAVDMLIDQGAIGIGGELFELLGCEDILIKRAATPEIGEKIVQLIENEQKRWSTGAEIETMSIGNYVGGLTTIEEKSLGALHKTGSRSIKGVLQIDKNNIEKPEESGFYLSETTMLCGGAGVNFAALGAQIILWTSGAAGFNNPLIPVIRISGNPDLYNEDMDIDARGIMDGRTSVHCVADKIVEKVVAVASGEKTAIEGIGEATMTLYQKDQRLENLLCIHASGAV